MDEQSVQLLARYRDGDVQAGDEIFHRYLNRLVGLARSRISSGLARRVEAEDVVQSVYRSFFAKADDGAVILRRSGDLWRLLAAITVNKVRKNARFHRQQKRTIEKEQPLAPGSGGLFQDVESLASGPTPEEAITVADELGAVMEMLDERIRQMLELRLQGHDLGEIGRTVGRSQRTVRRGLEDAEALLKRRLTEISGE